MKSFTLITALSICSFCWMSVSVSQCQTVEVQAGGEVTLLSANTSTYNAVSFWFRLVDRSEASCISVMFTSISKPSYCEGFENGKFEMTTNITTLSLKIKGVDSSDSGLYFSGFYAAAHLTFNVIHLNVEEGSEPHDDGDSKCKKALDETAKLVSVTLAGLTVLLVTVIIGLAVQVRKLHTAAGEEQNQQRENLDCGEQKDAALSLSSTTRNRRPASEREVETRVLYAASS
ncbi:hypothetical protein VZT92_016909 [Zoarces viviparus]|uniref:Immunoglobulin subtype domain-containing protein n=1 Tax=Zoarces viviparus TaxID=48416 RepID=A0AAW1EQH5_ZOAVI